MELSNTYIVSVDIKKQVAVINQTPIFTANDTAILLIKVYNDGQDYDYSEADRYVVSLKRPDGVIVTGQAEYEDGYIKYKLGSTEMEVIGDIETVIQLYLGSTRVTSRPFKIKIIKDFEDGIISTEEYTLLQKLFIEVDTVLREMDISESVREENEAIRQSHEIARQTNETERINAEQFRDENEDNRKLNELSRVNSENYRIIAESEREANENARSTNENIREQNEYERVQSEIYRQEAETIRQQQESKRQVETQTAISNAEIATEEAKSIANETRYIEPYNNATEYRKNNIVRYGKNSYIALRDTQGNVPNITGDTLYWGLLAIGGIDGTGSVSSVNNISPDENGNVRLTSLDVESIPLAEKGVIGGVAKINEQGKVVDADGNEVEGKVKSVNNIEPDDNGNIEIEEIIKSPTPPEGIVEGRIWLDTSDDTYQGTMFEDLKDGLDQINSKLGQPNGIALLNEDGKPVDSDGNEVGGGSGNVNSVNNVTPDENGNIPLTASNINTSDGISIQEEMTNLKLSASSVKNGIANVIGEPLLPSDTGQQMVDKIQNLKDIFAQFLQYKGITSVIGTESLQNLIYLVDGIESANVYYASGTVTVSSTQLAFQYVNGTTNITMRFVEITDLPFVPKKMIISINNGNTIMFRTIYEEDLDPIYPKTFKVAVFTGSTSTQSVYNLKADANNSVVSKELCILPIASTTSGLVGTWEAWGWD